MIKSKGGKLRKCVSLTSSPDNLPPTKVRIQKSGINLTVGVGFLVESGCRVASG